MSGEQRPVQTFVQPAEPAAPAPSPTDQLVDAWFVETFCNLFGLSTELFNHVQDRKEVLKARLRAKEP